MVAPIFIRAGCELSCSLVVLLLCLEELSYEAVSQSLLSEETFHCLVSLIITGLFRFSVSLYHSVLIVYEPSNLFDFRLSI